MQNDTYYYLYLISIFHEICIDVYLRNINYSKTVTKKHANSKSQNVFRSLSFNILAY